MNQMDYRAVLPPSLMVLLRSVATSPDVFDLPSIGALFSEDVVELPNTSFLSINDYTVTWFNFLEQYQKVFYE